MTHKTSAVLVCVCMSILTACSPPPAANSARDTVVVLASRNSDTVALADLRAELGATRVASLPRTNAEIWQFQGNYAQGVAALRSDPSLRFVEELGPVASAYSRASGAVGSLTATQLNILRSTTQGLAAGEFRVTGARPRGVSADLIDITAETQLGIPLLAEAVPVFSKIGEQRLANGDFVWSGRSVDLAGEAMLVVRPEGISGRVRYGADLFSVLPVGDGQQLVVRDTTREFPAEHPEGRNAGADVRLDAAADAPPSDCDPRDSDIDVFVTYSEEVKRSVSDPGGLAALAVVQANRSFEASKVQARLNLVGVQPFGYAESGSFDADVDAMIRGRIPRLGAARKATAADIVMMLVANRDYCGLAGDILAKAGTAYAVVSATCAVSNVSFAHEVGHLFGARHDRPTDDDDRPFKYGHGYALAKQWRTVMAYPGTCVCPREEFWADSALTHPDAQGRPQPTGVKDVAEDARVLRDTAAHLAQFRCRSSRSTN